MTEPTTQAGRTFLSALQAMDRINGETVPVDWAHGIAAIEAEARAGAVTDWLASEAYLALGSALQRVPELTGRWRKDARALLAILREPEPTK